MFRALSVYNDVIEQITDFEKLDAALRDPRKRIWLDIENHHKGEFEFLEKNLGFHPLLIEDLVNQNQRPKVDAYDNYTYIVVKIIDFNNPRIVQQLNIVLGPNYLVTVHSKPMPFLNDVWQRVEKNPSMLSRGADFALYALLDVFVDNIFPVVTEFDQQLDSVEDKIFKTPEPGVIAKLFTLKRKLFATRLAITPLREALTILARHESPLISKKNVVYYRDVYDHVIRITESLDNSREILTAAMEGYLSAISNNLNFIMKKLTAVMTIIMVPTLIAGIYGMNFPDIMYYSLGGTSAAFVLMGASAFMLGLYFRLRGWL